jgi:hypothetical protein
VADQQQQSLPETFVFIETWENKFKMTAIKLIKLESITKGTTQNLTASQTNFPENIPLDKGEKREWHSIVLEIVSRKEEQMLNCLKL